MKARDFLTSTECKAVVAAIVEAEKQTSGEIRVHIDTDSELSPLDAAVETFFNLEMDQTVHHNGVLFYIQCEKRQFAVIGDKGIDQVVPEGFWQDICQSLAVQFRQSEFARGLCEAIALCGEKLSQFFPAEEGDADELPNEISYGK